MFKKLYYKLLAWSILRSFSNVEEIVHTLRVKKIRGNTRSRSTCPIANYLRREMPMLHYVAVGDESVYGSDEDCLTDFHNSLPDSVIQFIKEFDNGKYPDLVDFRWWAVS